MTEKTPQEARAWAVAEQLAAQGIPVTARAVRDISHISMNVATPVAKSWNDQHAEVLELPAITDLVMVRVDALWAEAVKAVRAEHQAERDSWATTKKTLETERDAANEDATSVEKERDQLKARITELEAALQQADDAAAQAQGEVQEAQARTTAAEAATTAAEAATTAAEAVAAALQNAFTALSPRTEVRAQVGIDGRAEAPANEGDVVAEHGEPPEASDPSTSTPLAGI